MHSSKPPPPPPGPKKGGLTLPKVPRKGGMEKLLKGRGDPKKGEILQERGDAVSLGIFLAGVWQM